MATAPLVATGASLSSEPVATVTVTHSWPAARPDGSIALLFETREAGTIAFRLDQRSINLLRRQLCDCEAVLRLCCTQVQ